MFSISHENKEKDESGFLTNGKKINFDYPCSSQTDCSPYTILLSPGIYFLEVYGAQGQTVTSDKLTGIGGFGGYSCGVYKSKKPFSLYLHVGGSSKTAKKSSYNGGGYGNNIYDGAGGGATDFRIESGQWDQNLDSRLIIAGGGGGGFANDGFDLHFNGGHGGGLEGGDPTCSDANVNKSPIGTQQDSSGGFGSHHNGTLGKGADNYYAGGGGGYYGGGNGQDCGGGGGSGFIGNVTSFGDFHAATNFSTNEGPGKASITFISTYFICKTAKKAFLFHCFLIFITIMLK